MTEVAMWLAALATATIAGIEASREIRRWRRKRKRRRKPKPE